MQSLRGVRLHLFLFQMLSYVTVTVTWPYAENLTGRLLRMFVLFKSILFTATNELSNYIYMHEI